MLTIGLIPARGGSKRVPGKNTKFLDDKPLIQYTIEAAIESKVLDRLIVSTDCEQIALLAVELGAEVPFMRPEELSGDKSTDLDVLRHTIDWLSSNENYEVSNIVYLRPTTPFKRPDHIKMAVEKSQNLSFSGIRSVTKSEGVFHPYWMYFKCNNTLEGVVPGIKLEDFFQSQLLPDCYRLNGVVDVMKRETLDKGSLYGEKIGFVEVDARDAVDIDTQCDFEYCEFLINKNKESNERI